MSTVPLVALNYQPETAMQGYNQMEALQAQLRASQQQQQAAQRKQQETEVIRQSFVKNHGDLDKVVEEASQNPVVSLEALQALQTHNATIKKANADASDAALKLRAAQIDNLRGAFKPVYDQPADAPPEKLNALYQQQRAAVLQDPQAYGIKDPATIPAQFPGKEAGQFLMTSMVAETKQLEEERQRRELELKEQTDARAQSAGKTLLFADRICSSKNAPPMRTQSKPQRSL
jgi:DNA repair exonuclease SbcCD ATPase subunit